MEECCIGSRGSRLAVIQSGTVRDYLEKRGIRTQIITIKTKGDRILDRPLEKIGGKGLFVQELEQALRDGRIDLSVHSLKDVPMAVPVRVHGVECLEMAGGAPEDLPLIGFSGREDPRDVLVLPEGVSELMADKPIGCSSRRRILQAERLFPGMEFAGVRGNVETRLRKLDQGEFSGLILAAAGLKRLGLSRRISRFFSVEEMIPSAGQGILAIQGRADREYPELQGYCDSESALVAVCERTAIRCLAGDCTAPVAAYAEVDGQELAVRGMYDGADRQGPYVTACVRGSRTEPEKLGRDLAEVLRQKYRNGQVQGDRE